MRIRFTTSPSRSNRTGLSKADSEPALTHFRAADADPLVKNFLSAQPGHMSSRQHG
jgi:hypothetical protein